MPGPVKDGCIFCRIVAGTARAHPVWEDERTLVFLDLFPVAPGHTLLIPKGHWESLIDTPVDDLETVIGTSKWVAAAIRTTLAPDGIAVFQLNGAAAGQTVFHYHMHLVPRMHGSTLKIHGRRRAERADLDVMAQRIRAGLVGPRPPRE